MTDWQIITDGQNLARTLVNLKDSASNCVESQGLRKNKKYIKLHNLF